MRLVGPLSSLLVLSATLGAACHSRSDSTAALPAPVVTNLGFAADWIQGQDAVRLVAVSEAAQGRDLDGDGDVLDFVPFVLDLAGPSLVNTGVALRGSLPRSLPRDVAPPPFDADASEELVVFVASERECGRDLDGDAVLEAELTLGLDPRAPNLFPIPVVDRGLALAGPLAVFLTPDVGGPRLRVFDARDQSLVTLPGVPQAVPLVRGELVAHVQSEEGRVDLNLDGDRFDAAVLQYFDAGRRELVNTAWATNFGIRLAGGHFGTQVPESAQGGLDLDGDGRAASSVFVAIDTSGGPTRVPDAFVLDYADLVPRDDERFLLRARERAGEDRNGDGDSLDEVLVVYEPRSNRLIDSGLALRTVVQSAGRWVGVPVYELAQGGVDLDGDHALVSDVLHVFDVETGAVTSLGFEGHFLGSTEGALLMLRQEQADDWNGDGDSSDLVLFAWSAASGAVRNTGLCAASFLGAGGTRVLVAVSEAAQRADLDADGDQEDTVLVLLDVVSGAWRSLGLATDGRDARLGPSGAAALVPEQSQGRDLNGDGDLDDRVLHAIEL
jgi:hypothetical protein